MNILRYTFISIGVLMLAIAGYLGFRSITYLNQAVEVEGRVVSNIQYHDADTGYVYSPLVIFETVEGQKVEFIDSVRSFPPSYDPEDTVPVLYLPEDPSDAAVKGFFFLWGPTAIVGFVGSIFFIVGTILLFVKEV